MARDSIASTELEDYVDPTFWERLDRYFWPFDATNKLSNSIFMHKAAFCAFRVGVLAGLIIVLIIVAEERKAHIFAYPEVWGLFCAVGLYSLLCVNYICGRFWKYAHFLFELSWCVELAFTFIYWTFLFPLGNRWNPPSEATLHGGVMLVLCLDYLNNTIYFYRRHLRLILLITVLYIVISVPVSLTTYSAYRELSYKDAWSVLGVFLQLLLVLLAFLAGAGLDKGKCRYVQKPIDSPLMDFEDSLAMTLHGETKSVSDSL